MLNNISFKYMNKKIIFQIKKILILLLIISLFFLNGCESYNDINEDPPSVVGNINDKDEWYKTEKSEPITMYINFDDPNENSCASAIDILDAKTIDNEAKIIDINADVHAVSDILNNSEDRKCTFEDINNDLDPIDKYSPILHVNMSTSDFNSTTNNATFKIKGGFTRTATQKSYSLKLDSKKDLYLEQRKFMLTKSQSDKSRLRNKVAFNLFREIPNITSLQVNFIHLFINGEDYGLFNQAEAMRKEYLIHRNWSSADHLYNANNFYFTDSPILELDSTGEPLNPDGFNEIIEIKNGNDQSKLVEMIKAINTTNDIDSVIEKYFDRENYLTWLAVNLLLGEKDAIQHNFYLFNPANSNKFYFLPWDYDGAWATAGKYLSRTEYGISVWWKVALHKKFFTVPKNLKDLYLMTDKIRKEYISDEKVQKIVDKYINIVIPFQEIEPDSISNSEIRCQETAKELVSKIQMNIDLYQSVKGSPMPFEQRVFYDKNSSKLNINWDKSVDLEGDSIIYDLKVFDLNQSTQQVGNIICEKNEIVNNFYNDCNNTLKKGRYFLQIISREKDNSEHFQIAYDKLKLFILDENGKKTTKKERYYGTKEFIVE